MNRNLIVVAASVALVSGLFVHPAFADGSLPWETPLQIVLNALTGTTGTLLASLAVAGVGLMALAGRISWSFAGSVLFGIACLFGCIRIVAIFKDKTVAADPLFLGLTRPAMVWGVPQPLFVINGMVSMIVFLVSNSFMPLLIGAPVIHGVAYLACLKEVRIFDLWRIKALFLRCRNRRYWGANSYDPFL